MSVILLDLLDKICNLFDISFPPRPPCPHIKFAVRLSRTTNQPLQFIIVYSLIYYIDFIVNQAKYFSIFLLVDLSLNPCANTIFYVSSYILQIQSTSLVFFHGPIVATQFFFLFIVSQVYHFTINSLFTHRILY